jgi:uncharacterized protein
LAENPEPLIVGIDPGTTAAMAVIDIGGRLILLHSRKGLSRSDISRMISDLGSPIIIATDRRPAPSFVGKLAATFSARLSEPEENLPRQEKARISAEVLDGTEMKANQHERDALAAALHAYNRIRPTVTRVRKRLEDLGHEGDRDIESHVMSRVILHGDHVKRAIGKFSKD